ncbi:MAG: sugar phosphate nucleotidyltransferase [Bacteroidales bacterium]|nr:sugar phosphate nucleotidyltransferase [Bacteroidales bacterium]
MDEFNIIIPCCGKGQRFIDAGYEVYKPGLKFFDKPMLLHIIDSFPEKYKKWIITDSEHFSVLKKILKNHKNISFCIIDSHKNGPAWSILKAVDEIPQNQKCFVVYNDVFWKWDFSNVYSFIHSENPDGIVFTQTGYHPHLYKNSFSAFCKVENGKLIEIKEKGCFTDNWMLEPLSIGVYYFSNSSVMLENIRTLIENEEKIAGEYYPSVIYNKLIGSGLKVLIYEIKSFIHLGTPEQYEDAHVWNQIMNSENPENNIPILEMMCGTGSRMKDISEMNKAGLPIHSKPMFRFVADNYKSDRVVFLVNNDTQSFLNIKDSYINIGKQTSTQSESLLKALPQMLECKNVLITSNDCYGFFDLSLLDGFRNYDMVLFGFKLRLIHTKQGNAHSGFSFIGNNVTEISIKLVKKGQLGLAGLYYFPDIKLLKNLNAFDFENNGSVDHIASYLLKLNAKIGVVELKNYVHLGTLEEYYEFGFWKNFYNE